MQRRRVAPLLALILSLGFAALAERPGWSQAISRTPAFITALPNDGAVLVSWGTVLNAVGYNLYRRAPEVTVDKATLVNTSGPYRYSWLIDTELPNGQPLLYSVRAVFREGDNLTEGPVSQDVVVTPHAPLLGGFFAHDIGTTFPSSVSLEENVLTIRGSGVELWDQSDECTFVALPVSGDYSITVKLLDRPVGGHARSAKAGVMIREGLLPGDRYAFAMVMSGRGVYFEGRRSVRSGSLGSDEVNFAAQGTDHDATTLPVWLRLTKEGSIFTAFQSSDGTNFEQIGDEQDFGRIQPVTYVGLAVSAVHVNDESLRYATAQFDVSTLKIE